MNLIPFSYTNGPAGFVPVEALRAFKAKDAAVQSVMKMIDDAKFRALTDWDVMFQERENHRIIRANRSIRKNGWHFYSADNLPAGSKVAA